MPDFARMHQYEKQLTSPNTNRPLFPKGLFTHFFIPQKSISMRFTIALPDAGRKISFPVGSMSILTRKGAQVLAFLIGSLTLAALPAAAQGPDSSSLPAVWLRADKGEITSMLWSDHSGHKRHATALNGEGPVKDALFNYNPALSFDGINDYLKIPFSVEGLDELTIMAIFRSADTTEKGVWGAERGLARNILLTTHRAAGPDSTVDAIGNNGGFAVLNTVVQNWNKALTTSDSAYLALGSAGKQKDFQPFKGILAELLVFDKRLDLLEQLKYETYLALKYGIPLQDRNYVSTANKVVWAAGPNKKFAWRIAGLGKDSSLLLDQKQSRSAFDTAGLFTVSVGKLAPTNAENKAILPNGNFLVWGDNNEALTTAAAPGDSLALLERKWLMSASGSEAPGLKTSIRLDLKQLPPHPKGYWLVIDRSAQSEFSIDNLSYVLADSVSADSIAVYENVSWDSDRSGRDVFSFARSKGFTAVLTNLNPPSCIEPLSGRASFQLLGGRAPYQYELANTSTGHVRKGSSADAEGRMSVDALAAGNYSFRINDADGQKTTRTFSVTVPGALVIELGSDRKLTPGQPVVLDATRNIPDTAAVKYQWRSSYGLTATGGKISVTETGIYTVEVTNAQGCVYSDEVVVYGAGKYRFEVFPSLSTDGRYNVSISLPEQGNVNVYLADLKGNKLREMTGRNGSEFYFTGRIPTPGMYMVVWQTAKGTETRKIIVH